MLCSKASLITFFFNCPTSFHLLYFFYHFSSALLVKLFSALCPNATSHSSSDGYQAVSLEDFWFFTEDFLRKEEDTVSGIIYHAEAPLCSPKQAAKKEEPLFEDADQVFVSESALNHNPQASDSGSDEELSMEEDGESFITPPTETDSVEDDPQFPAQLEDDSTNIDATSEEECNDEENLNKGTLMSSISEDGDFFTLEATKFKSAVKTEREIIGDLFTDGSTSKDSSEWRNSSICRDSGTEDPFSSSSRRSCQNWESYTLYRKYDEEMMFFHRYSTEKLSEADYLRSIKVHPRSISERIVRKITTRNARALSQFHRNPYEELEAAYVAQICLAWEALNWNYRNFKRFKASRNDEDPGCSGLIAQQFQQFQVLLQRFIETEPYENGRRPEVYARTRKFAPNLLQVPEFIDSEDDPKRAATNTMISSNEFLGIMEDGIRTFMNFLKADKNNHCQMLKDMFKRNRKIRVDPILLHFMKKTNAKKKRKIKDIYKATKCFRKKRLKEEDEMEILMSLIDLKVVSRVLKMSNISDEQLRWCEEKMSKVKVLEGKVQRDSSSPLLFPAAH